MSRLKKEILGKLKEYAGKMGRDHLGGDDYTSKKKGGLRDFDGYDNVDYNKDMPMDEATFNKKKIMSTLAKVLRTPRIQADSIQQFIDVYFTNIYKSNIKGFSKISDRAYNKAMDYMKDLYKLDRAFDKDSQRDSGRIKKDLLKHLQKTVQESVINEAKLNHYRITGNSIEFYVKDKGKNLVLRFKDKRDFDKLKLDLDNPKDLQKILAKRPNKMSISMGESVNEAKDMTLSDYLKILDKKIEDAQKAVTGKNGSKEEYSNRGDINQNFKLFRNYISSMDKRHKGNKTKLRFMSENFDKLVEACWDTHKQIGMKTKGGKQVPNCVPKGESVVKESMFSTIDQIRQDSKDVRDFLKNVFKDRDFKKMSTDKDFIKYLKSIYEGVDESKGVPSNYMQGRTSDYHTALRGKNRDYSGGTNFKKTNHGQPDVEEDDEDQETNHLSNKQTHIKSPLKVAESGKKKSDKNYKDWKSSRLRKEISKKLKEYGQRLDFSFIEDEEAKLDGTYPSKDAIDKDIDETAKRDYKDEYKKFQSSKKSKKYRAELNKYNRDKGTYGNGDGKDASHKGGKIVGFESASKNRGRAEKSRLKKENVAPNHNDKSAPYGSGYKKVNEVGVFPIHNYIQGIIPTGYLDTNTPEKKKQSVKLVGNLKKTLNTFWKQNNIPFKIK
jgi:hypothetical protein